MNKFKAHASGFSLIELTVALSIAGIVLAMALPSFSSFVTGSKMVTTTNTLVTTLSFARSEAIKQNRSVSVCASDNKTTCNNGSWNNGWIVFTDEGTAGVVDGADKVLLVEQTLDSTQNISLGGKTYLQFMPTGILVAYCTDCLLPTRTNNPKTAGWFQGFSLIPTAHADGGDDDDDDDDNNGNGNNGNNGNDHDDDSHGNDNDAHAHSHGNDDDDDDDDDSHDNDDGHDDDDDDSTASNDNDDDDDDQSASNQDDSSATTDPEDNSGDTTAAGNNGNENNSNSGNNAASNSAASGGSSPSTGNSSSPMSFTICGNKSGEKGRVIDISLGGSISLRDVEC